MVADAAVRVDTAETRTRILAFTVDTRLVRGTVRVYDTFWATVWWRANHFRQTCALTSAAYYSWRMGVWSTWVGYARVVKNNRGNSWNIMLISTVHTQSHNSFINLVPA